MDRALSPSIQTKVIKFVVVAALVTFLGLFWKYYWKVQLSFNPNRLKDRLTPSSFPIDHADRKKYEKYLARGIHTAAHSRVIIAGLVRDVEESIPDIIQKCEKLGEMFTGYKVLIVENDSFDGTRRALLDWARINPNVVILGCGVNAKECKIPKTPKTEGHSVTRSRIDKMTLLRNIYLDYIKDHLSDPDLGYTYSVFWDLDSKSVVYEDGIHHSLGYMSTHPDVGVMCAYGIYHWSAFTMFYDTYALVDLGEPFHIDMKTPHDFRKGLWESKAKRGEPPREVESCFSGFSIYKTSELADPKVRYFESPPNNLYCEHTTINRSITKKKMMNPSMINLVLENS